MLKFVAFALLIMFLSISISCGGDSVEMEIDCSESDLEVVALSTSNADCQILGSLEVTGIGGVGNFRYSLNGIDFQNSGTFNIAAGNYTITVKDGNKCTATVEVTVNSEPNAVTITAIQSDAATCGANNSQITVIAMGGQGEFMYQLDQGDFQESNMFLNLSSGAYEVAVKDEEGCIAIREEQILTNTSLDKDIMPILVANCAISSSCHNSNSPRSDLSDKATVRGQSNTIKSRTKSGSMPPSSRPDLTEDEKQLIACWVDDGAKNN